MGSQYPPYFSEAVDVKLPPNPAMVVTPGYPMNDDGGGYEFDRFSNISTDSHPSYSDFSPLPPSPMPDMSSFPVYSGNPLPSQQYDPPYTSFHQETEKARHTPTSLGWGVRSADFVKLYKLIVPKGKLPYLELLEKWTPTYQTPPRVHLEEPSGYGKTQFPCLYPSCNAKQTVFSRPADRERHLKNVHASNKDAFHCDYPNCPRAQDPFTRKDHCRDHLRDYHKEDIGAAKGEKSSREKDKHKWQRAQRIWLSERNISYKSWRCAKCLVKNSVRNHGWACSSCKNPCEEDRVRIREKLASERQTIEHPSEVPMVETSQYTAPFCGTCNDSAYLDNGNGAFEACHVCQPPVQAQYSYANSYPNIIYE